jgi:predicted RNA-binding protein YlqC (UPF0109 family)
MSAGMVPPDVEPRPRPSAPDGTRFIELTRFIVERMVGSPQAVSVRAIPRGRSTILEVEVAEDDKGKLIGKGGRNIDAVRAVVRAAGLRGGQRVQVELAGRR